MVEGYNILFWRVAGRNSDRIGKMLLHNQALERAKSREPLRNPMYRFGELSGKFSRKIYSNVNEHFTNDHSYSVAEW